MSLGTMILLLSVVLWAGVVFLIVVRALSDAYAYQWQGHEELTAEMRGEVLWETLPAALFWPVVWGWRLLVWSADSTAYWVARRAYGKAHYEGKRRAAA